MFIKGSLSVTELTEEFFVENLDMNAAESVIGNGYAFALPLKLMDAPGAPCRLIVLTDK